MSSESVSVFAKLKEHGLLLQTDANLPNVCALVVGAWVRGSWWAHPRSHEIFRVNGELAEHPDVPYRKRGTCEAPGILESWDHWSGRTGYIGKQITSVNAKLTLEDVVASLNRKFKGRGRLPWQA